MVGSASKIWFRDLVAHRIPALSGVSFILFLFLPLMVYSLNLDVVDVSKRSLWLHGGLFAGITALCLPGGGPGPADWLVEWTNWAVAFFGITIGGRALFWGGTRLRDQYLKSNN